MVETFIYKGIKVSKHSEDNIDFKGVYLGEKVMGYALDLDHAKEKIDESIYFIEEFNEDSQKFTPTKIKIFKKENFLDD